MAGWQQQCTKSDAELEVNGLRADVAYTVQPVDCSACTVVPAYMDLNDAQWDDDPRVQHWRRETQLGRMPRRETPKPPGPGILASTSAPQQRTVRDPRLKSDSTVAKSQFPQPASTVSGLQLQQQNIQQMVQQLMQSATLTSASTAAVVPTGGPVMTSAPSSVTSDMNTSQLQQLPQPNTSVNLALVTGQSSSQQSTSLSVPPPSLTVQSLVPANTMQHDVVVPSVSLPAIANNVQESFKVPLSGSENLPSAVITKKTELDRKESDLAGKQRRIDYYNDPRFKKRKTKSPSGTQDSSKSSLPVSDSKPSSCESARIETGLQSKDVMQFQSPLAAADNIRQPPTASGYNRPPNKRYQELLEQGNQQPYRDRYTGFTDPRRKPVSEASNNRQLEKSTLAHSTLSATLDAAIAYPGIISQDMLSTDSLAKGSLKDMFKTIDPTASPFC